MFILRVHSVDTNHPLTLEDATFSPVSTAAATTTCSNPKSYERRGVSHLYRKLFETSLPSSNPSSRSTSLFVAAVPNYFSATDFIRFCGPYIDDVRELLFIRNDGVEDRYSVLIELENQLMAKEFYSHFNGKRFSPAEAEVCHILFLFSVEYTEFGEMASTPPVGFTELPTCPICLERLDPHTSGILSTLCDHSFQCSCTTKWTYLSCQVCRHCQQQVEKPACSVCGIFEDLWVCLICGFARCGRYKEGHALRHWQDTQHCYSLGLRSQQIWDYVGENYVHRLNQSKADDIEQDRIEALNSFDEDNFDVSVNDLNDLDFLSTIDGGVIHADEEEEVDSLRTRESATTRPTSVVASSAHHSGFVQKPLPTKSVCPGPLISSEELAACRSSVVHGLSGFLKKEFQIALSGGFSNLKVWWEKKSSILEDVIKDVFMSDATPLKLKFGNFLTRVDSYLIRREKDMSYLPSPEEVDRLKLKVDASQIRSSSLQDVLLSSKAEIEDLDLKISRLQEEKGRLATKIDKLQDDLQDTDENIQKLSAEQEEWKKKETITAAEVEAIDRERKELRRTLLHMADLEDIVTSLV